MGMDDASPGSNGTMFIRFSLETNLSPQQFAELLPLVASRTATQAAITYNPILHVGVTGMENEVKQDSRSVSVGPITGSAVGSIGSARDVNVYMERVRNSSLSEELKIELSKAHGILEKSDLSDEDKKDVAEDLGKLTSELEKDESKRDAGRVARFFKRIKEVAPTVAAALSIVASIVRLSSAT